MDVLTSEKLSQLNFLILQYSGQIDKHDLYKNLQSSNKEAHCVETALAKLYDDLLCAVDDNKCVLFCLFDHNAAFDTIDYQIMLQRLEIVLVCLGTF